MTDMTALRLEVFPSRYHAVYFVAQATQITGYSCFVDKHKSIPLCELEKVQAAAAKCDSLKIIIQGKRYKWIVNLPKAVSDNILQFIKQGRPDPKFNCVDFINFAHGRYKQLNKLSFKDWAITRYQADKELQPGQIVVLYRATTYEQITLLFKKKEPVNIKKEVMKHFTIYLVQDVFLSLIGSGPLLMTSLIEMHKMYKTNAICLLEPK